MNQTALLLHGWNGNSDENWFPWLQKELNRRYFDVYTPNLPNTKYPNIDEQMEYVSVYSGDFQDGCYIIAHSLGCKLALKFIEENEIKNSHVILIAPVYPGLSDDVDQTLLGDSGEFLQKYIQTDIDIKKINTLDNKYHIFLSDNDYYINIEHARKYYQNLKNVQFTDFTNKGHFNKAAGVLELQEIMDIIEK